MSRVLVRLRSRRSNEPVPDVLSMVIGTTVARDVVVCRYDVLRLFDINCHTGVT
jgi:hypothetical protein